MRSYDEIATTMQAGYTFSNTSEFEQWSAKWCSRCAHENGCPIVDAAMIHAGTRPAEWVRRASEEPFVCTEFRAAS